MILNWEKLGLFCMAQRILCLFVGDTLVEDALQAIYRGAMQSMYLFMEEKKSAKGIRFSLENFARLNQIDVYPLYAVRNMLSAKDTL